MSISQARESISSLRGEKLKISVNKGRKRIVNYNGEIEEIYPFVFILKINNEKNLSKLSCSYSDFIGGTICLKKL